MRRQKVSWAGLSSDGSDPSGKSAEDGSAGASPSPTGTPGSTTRLEDEADAWAGEFLARYGYDLEAVAAYLETIPYDPADTLHSPGPERAKLILATLRPAQ